MGGCMGGVGLGNGCLYGRIGVGMQWGLGDWRRLMRTCMLGRKQHKVRSVCLFIHAVGESWVLTYAHGMEGLHMHMGWRVCVWEGVVWLGAGGWQWCGLKGGERSVRGVAWVVWRV